MAFSKKKANWAHIIVRDFASVENDLCLENIVFRPSRECSLKREHFYFKLENFMTSVLERSVKLVGERLWVQIYGDCGRLI